MGQAATDMAHAYGSKLKDPVGDATAIHQIAGKYEKGDSQEGK
ncbi:hypothetical protein GCM10022394_30040 [Zobellella aerophila]|uniref:Uncharacterized protein n=1 Tax=Zobellella aerophila TaxID=870480 RepID=A0ABP6WCD2_9GAMM